VFQARSGNLADAPRTYTVEPGKQLSGSWSVGASGYDLAVHGPNGFFRSVKGAIGAGRAVLDVRATADGSRNEITLTIANRGSRSAHLTILDGYSRDNEDNTLAAGASTTRRFPLEDTSGWYDLLITVAGDAGFAQHQAGHVETGKPSTSDPALGSLVNR